MDIDLVIRAQRGDKEAFALLVYAIADRFLAVSHRILRDLDLAEDATQQALLNVWQDLPRLRDPARFEAWSYRLLVHACYAEGRKSRRWAPNLTAPRRSAMSVAEARARSSIATSSSVAFRRLSRIIGRWWCSTTTSTSRLDRVADIVGVPFGTVGSRLHYATRQLRSALIADAQPTPREVAQ